MTDTELITKVKANDFGAFNVLVQKYERLVFSMLLKLITSEEDVKDLAQEVFLQVFKKIKTYRAESSLATWIGRIAYNFALNHLKKNKIQSTENAESIIENTFTEHSPEEAIIKAEQSIFIQEQIKLLPEKYKIVITLYHSNEMSYKEIATITKTSEASVKTNLFRGRKLLKNRLKGHLTY